MGFVTVRAQLKAQLDALVPATLSYVFNGEQDSSKVEPPASPFAELRRVGNTNEFFSQSEDLVEHSFEVWVYTDIENKTIDLAEIALDPVVDAIMQQLITNRVAVESALQGIMMPVTSGSGLTSWGGRLLYVNIVTVKVRHRLS